MSEGEGRFVLYLACVQRARKPPPPQMLIVSIVSEGSMNAAFSYGTI